MIPRTPVFQVPSPLGFGSIPEVTISNSGSESLHSKISRDKPWGRSQYERSISTATSVPTTSSSSSQTRARASGCMSQTQLERNYIIINSKYKQTEKENVKLRENRLADRADLARLGAVLDGVFVSEELSQGMFEKLSWVSDMLLKMKGRLVSLTIFCIPGSTRGENAQLAT